ncbi:hypothetical protein SAMN02745146_0602 [Hymenobacter daecheongensis DSM 21074]|uniref:Uncharacterized protein n=1 Tax=Hymenobacter daecheongensis DSM 21074 TaxID=1121955 RepID=A0A1M6ADU8_9BACT|nr:hypothetical protein [Hymenobacter daecheongensis]SHI34592.1 hypothetical protein SAMN02745146_0602 [Hymenobacter daecheongensis DSM 21074]
MNKKFLLGLLAGASLLTLSVTSCQNPDYQTSDDVATEALPPIPAAPDTTGGKTAAENPATREINAANATEDIKKMQPQM